MKEQDIVFAITETLNIESVLESVMGLDLTIEWKKELTRDGKIKYSIKDLQNDE